MFFYNYVVYTRPVCTTCYLQPTGHHKYVPKSCLCELHQVVLNKEHNSVKSIISCYVIAEITVL